MLNLIHLGLTKLRYSASQRRMFACGSKVLLHRSVCGFSALRAENPHTIKKERTAAPEPVEGLPKVQHTNCAGRLKDIITPRSVMISRARHMQAYEMQG